MATTVTIDDELLAKARVLAVPGVSDTLLVTQCIMAFIQREAALRLAESGGCAPSLEVLPRRRYDWDPA